MCEPRDYYYLHNRPFQIRLGKLWKSYLHGHVEFFQPITQEQLTSEFCKHIAGSGGKFYNSQFFNCNKTENTHIHSKIHQF